MSSFDPNVMRRHRVANRAQALLLMAALAGVLIVCANMIAGREGVIVSIFMVAAGVLFLPRVMPSALIRAFRALPLDPAEAPDLYALLGNLAARSGLADIPHVFLMPAMEGNAFSVVTARGPVIVLSQGLLSMLRVPELAAVLAHEVAHIAAGDVALLSLSEVIGRFIRSLAMVGLILALGAGLAGQVAVPLVTIWLLAVAPFAATLLQLALSRNREYDADQVAAALTSPAALADALAKIEASRSGAWWHVIRPYAHSEGSVLLRTHPTTRDRIERLLRHRR